MSTPPLPRNRVSCWNHTKRTRGCRPCADQSARYNRHRVYETNNGRPRTVDGLGTRRRLQGLTRDGHDLASLAPRLGLASFSNVGRLRSANEVWAGTAARVAVLFDELAGTVGPSRVAAERAAKRGWPPALAWDNPDDPDEVPDPGWSPSRGGGTDIQADIDDIAWLITCGANWVSIVDRLGRSKESIERTLRRSYRHDLLRRLTLATSGPDQLLTSVEVRAMRTIKSGRAA